jgi:UDP-N-acetyl-D-mannosaminuronate dehydrogenase
MVDGDDTYPIEMVTEIARLLKKYDVVLESTVYPGVTDEVLRPVLEESGLKAGADFGLSYCPERYNPGDAAHGYNHRWETYLRS